MSSIKAHLLTEQNMHLEKHIYFGIKKMWLKTLFNILKVAMILALLFLNSKSLEAARALDDMNMKSKPEPQDRAPVPPSAPSPCTYIPESDDEGCH